MLALASWLLIYGLLVVTVGVAVGPWRTRAWFKVTFLPGVLLALTFQKISAVLWMESPCRISALRDRAPPLTIAPGRVPCLSGAGFVTASHGLLFVVSVVVLSRLGSMGCLPSDPELALPDIPAHSLLAGDLGEDPGLGRYGGELARLASALQMRSTVAAVLFLWVFAGAIATLAPVGRQVRWGLYTVAASLAAGYVLDWFGIGFPFLTRGWWAEIFYFDRWWRLVSLHVTAVVACAAGFGTLRVLAETTWLLLPRAEEPDAPAAPAGEEPEAPSRGLSSGTGRSTIPTKEPTGADRSRRLRNRGRPRCPSESISHATGFRATRGCRWTASETISS